MLTSPPEEDEILDASMDEVIDTAEAEVVEIEVVAETVTLTVAEDATDEDDEPAEDDALGEAPRDVAEEEAPSIEAASPRRARKRGKAPKLAPPQLEKLVEAVCASLEDDKAENIVVLDVSTRSSYADRLIIASGLAERQILAMAQHVEEALEELGLRRLSRQASPEWVLLDAGDIIIHLFKPEARELYALERMWGPDSPPPEEYAGLDSEAPAGSAADAALPESDEVYVFEDEDEDDLDGEPE